MVSIIKRICNRNSMTGKAISLIPYYRVFRKKYKFLQKSQWWSREQLEEYQLQQLSKLLTHAYENVPYYRKVFDDRGLKPQDIQDFSDLQKLPFLTKEIIRDNLDDLKARNYPGDKFEYVTTGGSTGNPLGLYHERGVSRANDWAFLKILWDQFGYHFRDKCVVLRGNVIKSADKGKFFEYSFFGRWLILSSYHMSDENLPKYIEEIRKFKPKFIQAYPSAITILARFMKEHNIEPFRSIKALLCASENLYRWQRELLEEVFQCRVFSFYGHVEHCAFAVECEKSSHYHIVPEYGYVEIIGTNENHVEDEREMGEIVATGFNNYVMPFIRYKTGDIAVCSKKKCSCGRNYPLLDRIEGRIQDFFISHKGALIPLTGGTEGLVLQGSIHIEKAQFYQEKKGHVLLKIVKKKGYTNDESQKILKALNKRYGEDLDFKIKFVDDIPRTKAGKFMFLIQKLPIEL